MHLHRYLILLCLAVSPPVMAADGLGWKSYLAIIVFISILLASFSSWRQAKDKPLMARLLLAGLYFWVSTFAQLIVAAIIYHYQG